MSKNNHCDFKVGSIIITFLADSHCTSVLIFASDGKTLSFYRSCRSHKNRYRNNYQILFSITLNDDQ